MSQTIRYDYTGDVQTVTLPPGGYFLEAFGACGGSWSANSGGKGGYACGELILTESKTLFLCVGGAGKEQVGAAGGYNGGGKAGTSGYGASGGGATHIAIGTTNRGVLSNYDTVRNEVLLVAGGGGGAGGSQSGLDGGGITGRLHSEVYCPGNGESGTQTTGYAFGRGQSRIDLNNPVETVHISGNASFTHISDGPDYYTTLATIDITADGTLIFESYHTGDDRGDPCGFVYKNGEQVAYDDDSAPNSNFFISISVNAGDTITLKMSGWFDGGHVSWYCDYPNTTSASGGGGGGGWYGGFCATENHCGGGGGSGYANSSLLKKTSLTKGANNSGNGYILITKTVYKINLKFENCSGTSDILLSPNNTSSIITYDGEAIMIGSTLSRFIGYVLPENNDYVTCTLLSQGQCKIELKYDTRDLLEDITYTIKAVYQEGRLNSNLYKNIHLQSVFDFFKLVGE